MTADERLQWAFRVVPGDRVTSDGHQREVTGSRVERYATGGLAVVLAFQTGFASRMPATALVTVPPLEPPPAETPSAEVARDGSPARAASSARLVACSRRGPGGRLERPTTGTPGVGAGTGSHRHLRALGAGGNR
ncbi:hypothetical protein ACFXOY_28975 [Streptomyces niveus]|uniref:hypothetical protein n=1 Tax=Streptomyces niveus TaxID=193462 RepID=UPI0036804BFA